MAVRRTSLRMSGTAYSVETLAHTGSHRRTEQIPELSLADAGENGRAWQPCSLRRCPRPRSNISAGTWASAPPAGTTTREFISIHLQQLSISSENGREGPDDRGELGGRVIDRTRFRCSGRAQGSHLIAALVVGISGSLFGNPCGITTFPQPRLLAYFKVQDQERPNPRPLDFKGVVMDVLDPKCHGCSEKIESS